MAHHGKSKPVVFLDRDGTLNPDPGYIRSVEQYEFYVDTLDALEELARAGFVFVVVTNQSGIGRGIVEEVELKEIHDYVKQSFGKRDIPLLGIYYCPHKPEEGCECRKPRTGLFSRAARDHSIDIDESYVIGDSIGDMEAGKRLGMKTALVRTGNGKSSENSLLEKGVTVDFVGDSIRDCAHFILMNEPSR